MVFGKNVAISIGNVAEIWPLVKGRKFPVRYHLGHIALQYSFILHTIMICSRNLPGFGKLVNA